MRLLALRSMPFTPPQSHWRGAEPTEWDTALLDESAPADGHRDAARYPRITRGEQIAIVVVALAMLLAAWWLR